MENNNLGGIEGWMDCESVSVSVDVKKNVQAENMNNCPHCPREVMLL